MALILPVRGKSPRWGADCFIAENATLVGELEMGDNCSVWFSAVIRADVAPVRLGNRVNVQDLCCIHGTYERAATWVGDDVSIGHRAILHGCRVEAAVLVGMGAIIMDNAHVESNVIVGAGAVVPAGMRLTANGVYAGIPARRIKELDPEQRVDTIERIAAAYPMYASWFQ